jgi:hypothetical protein
VCVLYLKSQISGRYLLYYVLGFAIHMYGVYVSVVNSPLCSTPCPEDCPLPVPHLNHNGFTHITEMLGYVPITLALLGAYEGIEGKGGKRGGKKAA